MLPFIDRCLILLEFLAMEEAVFENDRDQSHEEV